MEMSKGAVVVICVVVAALAFVLGRSTADRAAPSPPVTSSPATVPSSGPEKVFVTRIPDVCREAISFAQAAYGDLTDVQFVYADKQFSNLPVDSTAWHKAAVDLAFKVDKIKHIDLSSMMISPKTIPTCYGRMVQQNNP